jgi:acyl-CoA thioesterase FadM
MEPWIETYRGAASAWECDVTEHFTMGFYFDRIAMAEAALAEELGLLDTLRAGGLARCFEVRLVRELHAGSAFHIESAALGDGGDLHLGHRVVDSASGEIATWFRVRWEGCAARLPRERIGVWDGPQFATWPQPRELTVLIPSMAGRVQPGDLDEFGRMGLPGMIHKFSDAAVQFGAAIGLTADYIETARRSFSAFELRLRIARWPKLGDAYCIDTGLAHLGNTSLRYLHVMRDPKTGQEIARMDRYGVQLDLDARRPAPLAPELRRRAQCLLLPMNP